ncbi:MAG TPA: TrkA family potassium uptake protein [Acidimicrobiales bacterium]|nr:TrkA family potassium uptake protein [Acidimicrobiales bacterium]
MHVVVVGCGRVGSGLAVKLADLGHSVAILDKNPRAFRRLPPEWPGKQVRGSGFDRDDLEEAGAIVADALAAVTSGDNSNILTARIARETYGIANVVARIYDPRRAEIYQRLGIPTVATVTWTIDHVMQRLLPDSVVGEWTDETGRLVFAERVLPDSWAGRPLRELEDRGQIRLIGVTRAGVARLDATDLVGQEDDLLHIAFIKDALEMLESRLGPSHTGGGTDLSGLGAANPSGIGRPRDDRGDDRGDRGTDEPG